MGSTNSRGSRTLSQRKIRGFCVGLACDRGSTGRNRDSSEVTKAETSLARAADGHGTAYCRVKSIMGKGRFIQGLHARSKPRLVSAQSCAREREAIVVHFLSGSLCCTSLSLNCGRTCDSSSPSDPLSDCHAESHFDKPILPQIKSDQTLAAAFILHQPWNLTVEAIFSHHSQPEPRSLSPHSVLCHHQACTSDRRSRTALSNPRKSDLP